MQLPRFTLLVPYRAPTPVWGSQPYATTQPEEPTPKFGIASQYESIRAVLRNYNAASLVRIALQTLQRHAGALEALPWITLLLVKWALQDRAVQLRLGPDMPQSVLDDLRQAVWDIPGRSEQKTAPRAQMRTLLAAQIPFQKAQRWGCLRWPALIMRLDPDHRCRRQFRSIFQMEPLAFMDLVFKLQEIADADIASVTPEFLSSLEPLHGPAVQRMVDLVSRDLPALRSALREPETRVVHGRGELREFPYLQRFPLLRDNAGGLHCWHPMVITRGLEEVVHLRLSALGKAYTDAFSPVFEAYVLELLRDARPTVLIEEAQYWAAFGRGEAAVDAIWRDGGVTLLVEAKFALFGDAVLVNDVAQSVRTKLVRVLEGIAQARTVAQALSGPGHPFFDAHACEFFQIIVVPRELYVGTGQSLAQLLAAEELAPAGAQTSALLPPEHIFVVAIEDFEQTMVRVRDGDVVLSTLLRRAVADNADGMRAKTLLADHLDDDPGRAPPGRGALAPLIAQARDECVQRLEALAGQDPDETDP